jgi:hypothetical protein
MTPKVPVNQLPGEPRLAGRSGMANNVLGASYEKVNDMGLLPSDQVARAGLAITPRRTWPSPLPLIFTRRTSA